MHLGFQFCASLWKRRHKGFREISDVEYANNRAMACEEYKRKTHEADPAENFPSHGLFRNQLLRAGLAFLVEELRSEVHGQSSPGD